MTDDDRRTFGRELTRLAETLGEPMSPARIDGYWRALCDLPLSAVLVAMTAALRECAEFFPKPGWLRAKAMPAPAYVMNATAYRQFVPPVDTRAEERPRLDGPISLRDVVASLQAKLDTQEGTPHGGPSAEEVAARKELLRAQAKQLLLDEPEGTA
jgi:hypothetical protein